MIGWVVSAKSCPLHGTARLSARRMPRTAGEGRRPSSQTAASAARLLSSSRGVSSRAARQRQLVASLGFRRLARAASEPVNPPRDWRSSSGLSGMVAGRGQERMTEAGTPGRDRKQPVARRSAGGGAAIATRAAASLGISDASYLLLDPSGPAMQSSDRLLRTRPDAKLRAQSGRSPVSRARRRLEQRAPALASG